MNVWWRYNTADMNYRRLYIKILEKTQHNQETLHVLQLHMACQYIKMCVLIIHTFCESLVMKCTTKHKGRSILWYFFRHIGQFCPKVSMKNHKFDNKTVITWLIRSLMPFNSGQSTTLFDTISSVLIFKCVNMFLIKILRQKINFKFKKLNYILKLVGYVCNDLRRSWWLWWWWYTLE